MSSETRAKIEQWLQAERHLYEERDTLIREARAEHCSLREIADLFELSHTEIRRILNNDKGTK